jgi:NAD(P)-dependent dehydrogenase (short-subunit alcohol dehydrogenase family)
VPENLQDQVAVVTGGTRGIGAAITRALLAEGVKVAICGRSPESVEQALAEMHDCGSLQAHVCDVGRFEQVQELFRFVENTHGRLDILINNAGIGKFARVDEISPEGWREVIDTNLNGTFYCCREAIPLMRKTGGGFIINVVSLAGKHAFAGGSAYNASKFGVNGLTEAIMQDLRADNIRVSQIMPGSVDTKFGSGAGAADWKIAPEHIAETAIHLLRTPQRSLISRVEMRPSRPPGK